MESKKNILVIGNSSTVSVFAKIIAKYSNVGKIYSTYKILNAPDNIEFVDIREDAAEELLKFAITNDVNLTAVFSQKALKSDIAGIFNANGQLIFAPELKCAKQLADKSCLKKLLYKLKVKIPQFGIFDKQTSANDYLKKTNLPVIISSPEITTEDDLFACPTLSVGNIAINDLFFRGEEKVILDEYISGHNFTTYIITDGVSAIPIATLSTEKFSDDVEGGFLTPGSAAFTPDLKITQDIENYMVYDVWEKLSSDFEKSNCSYVGIAGICGVLKNDELFITDIHPGIVSADAPVLLNVLDENLISLFEACAIGSFTDDYDVVNTKDNAIISLGMFSNSSEKDINWTESLLNPDNIDFCTKNFNNKYITKKGFIGTIWAEGRTITTAKQKLYEDIDTLSSNGIKFRKDLLLTKVY
ncbi:hypothetical protein J6S88_03855 [bacterium]|nr:hypothetical protein [bacterium]